MKKIKLRDELIGVLLVFLAIFTLFLLSNTTSIQSGTIYYCSDGKAYCYNALTRTSKAVKIEGYDVVSWYYPTKDGYIAYVFNQNDNIDNVSDDSKILLNGKIILETEDYLTHISCNGNYLFFTIDDYYLKALNVNTKETIDVSDAVYYGYSFVGNYLYYNERNPKTPDEETDIYIADCTKNNLEIKIVDKGIICTNTYENLVFTKNNHLYQYDFENNKAELIDDYLQVKDNYQYRFIGTLNTDSDNLVIHLKQKVIYGSNYYEYENELLQGLFLPTKEHFQILPMIQIKDDKGALYIPVKRLDYFTERYSVVAYENKGKIYYANQPCLKWIY